MEMIQHPLIHVALTGVVAWYIGRALWTGRITLNSHVRERNRQPVGYWFGIAVGCFLVFALGEPVVRAWWK